MTTTDVLAIIGAVTGIIGSIAGITALCWDFYKWRYSERVRLKVSANLNFVATTNTHQKLLSISVTNVGKLATTIKVLSFHGFDSKKEMKSRNGKGVSIVMNPTHGTLPVKLNPQDDWTGLTDQSSLTAYKKYKFFVVQIEDTMSDFPARAIVDLSLMK